MAVEILIGRALACCVHPSAAWRRLPPSCPALLVAAYAAGSCVPPLITVSADRRTVVITGSSSGIGKAAARRFASEGDHVVMAVRNLEAGERARAEVVEAAGGGSAEVMALDVSAFASVREFARAFRERHPRLDVRRRPHGKLPLSIRFSVGVRSIAMSLSQTVISRTS